MNEPAKQAKPIKKRTIVSGAEAENNRPVIYGKNDCSEILY